MMVDFAIRAEREEGLLRLESIQSLSVASSAHPHDHHVRHARRPAACAREWNRVGATPAAGIRDRRQAPLEPDPDALLDPVMYLALDRLQTGVFGPGLQWSVNCRLGSSGHAHPIRPSA